jgi:hypothetical protein
MSNLFTYLYEKVNNKKVLCIFYLTGLLYLFQSSSFSQPIVYKLIDKTKAFAVIDISSKYDDILFEPATDLQGYVQESTGIRLPFKHELISFERYPICIHLTIQESTKKKSYLKTFRHMDGFCIDLSNQNHIWIKGNSAAGTKYGVYEFLERFVGIRWLFPGKSGEHIPKRHSLIIKSQSIEQIPAFVSRQLSGLSNKEAKQWAGRLRMLGRIRFHHNLHNIFPVEKYSKTHSHLYPQKNGNVIHARVGWQPCFQEKDTVDIAVEHIINYFENNQIIHSFSLATNDAITATSGYCHTDIEPGRLNIWGYPNASNVYYDWTNIVAKKVLNRFPDKIFGTLAYMEAAMPPKDFVLNDHIIPFLTEDRLRWVKPESENKAKNWVNNWRKKSKNIGFYDYFYGTPYVLPRVYFHHMADIYQFAQRSGVMAVYAEAYPNWGEGPKLYLALKLFWNPMLNIDEHLDNWYTCCVGKRAAKYLSQYFSLWESFWMRIHNTKWYYNKSMYMAFWSPSYLDFAQLTDIQESRRLLEKTVAYAQTPLQKKRAQLFLDAFEYYEASAISYWGLKTKRFNIKKKLAKEMSRKRYLLIQKFENDPFLKHVTRFDKGALFPALKW